MVRSKGWTWDRHGGTCDRCQGKAKTADVIQLRYTPETTYGVAPPPTPQHRCIIPPGYPKTLGQMKADGDWERLADRLDTSAETIDIVPPHGTTKLAEVMAIPDKAERDAAFWRSVRDGTIPNPYLAAEAGKPAPRRHYGRYTDPAFHEEIRPFVDDGYTDRAIAELAGCSHDTIRLARITMGKPTAREISRQRKGNDMGEVTPMKTTQPETASMQPTIKETISISEKLDAFFDTAAGRYKSPWTDQKIGEALNLPAAKVAAVRVGLDMHLRGDPELAAIREELAAVEKLVADLRQRLDRAERKAGEGNIR